MIRLYPAVVKREENIQDLRRLLSDLYEENRSQYGQLSEGAGRIRDLSTELRQAELARNRFHQESSNVTQGAQGLRERLGQQLKSRADLQGLLARSQAALEQHSRRLAESQHASQQRQEVIFDGAADLEAANGKFGEHGELERQLRGRLGDATQGRQRLSREYREAEQSATVRRCELREAGLQSMQHGAIADGHGAELGELQLVVDKLSDVGQSLKNRLASMHDTPAKSARLEESLSSGRRKVEEMRATLAHLEPAVEKLRSDVEGSEQNVQDLKEMLAPEDADVSDFRAKLSATLAQNSQVSEKLNASLGEGRDLRSRLEKSEQEAQRLEDELSGRVEHCTCEVEELEGRASQLDDHVRCQNDELEMAEAKRQDWLAALAKHGREKEDLLAKSREAELLHKAEKERCRCVVS